MTNQTSCDFKKCPFCGSLDVGIEDLYKGEAIVVACENCGARGPNFEVGGDAWPTRGEAERAAAQHWNDRPSERAKPIYRYGAA